MSGSGRVGATIFDSEPGARDRAGAQARVVDGALRVELVGGGSLVTNPLDTLTDLFDPDPAVTDGDGLRVVASTATAGAGLNGPGITFGAIGTSSKRAALTPWQDTADPDQVGMSFWTHPSATATDSLVEVIAQIVAEVREDFFERVFLDLDV